MDLLALPIDIKQYICSISESIWMWFVVNDLEFRAFAYTNWRLFVELFTQRNTIGDFKETRLFGKLHSIYGEPAIANVESKEWYMAGITHRYGDLPAYIAYGYFNWSLFGKTYREIDENGTQFWYNIDDNRLFHRNELDEYGKLLPAIIYAHGTMLWYRDGELHREEGLPTVVYNRADQYAFLIDDEFYNNYPIIDEIDDPNYYLHRI